MSTEGGTQSTALTAEEQRQWDAMDVGTRSAILHISSLAEQRAVTEANLSYREWGGSKGLGGSGDRVPSLWPQLSGKEREDLVQGHFDLAWEAFNSIGGKSLDGDGKLQRGLERIPFDVIEVLRQDAVTRRTNEAMFGSPMPWNDPHCNYPSTNEPRYDKVYGAYRDNLGTELATEEEFEQVVSAYRYALSIPSLEQAQAIMRSSGCPQGFKHSTLGLDEIWRRAHEPRPSRSGSINPTSGSYTLSRREIETSDSGEKKQVVREFEKKSALRRHGARKFESYGLKPLPGFGEDDQSSPSSATASDSNATTSLRSNSDSNPSSNPSTAEAGNSAQFSFSQPAATPASQPASSAPTRDGHWFSAANFRRRRRRRNRFSLGTQSRFGSVADSSRLFSRSARSPLGSSQVRSANSNTQPVRRVSSPPLRPRVRSSLFATRPSSDTDDQSDGETTSVHSSQVETAASSSGAEGPKAPVDTRTTMPGKSILRNGSRSSQTAASTNPQAQKGVRFGSATAVE